MKKIISWLIGAMLVAGIVWAAQTTVNTSSDTFQTAWDRQQAMNTELYTFMLSIDTESEIKALFNFEDADINALVSAWVTSNIGSAYDTSAELDALFAGKADALGADDNYVTDAEKVVIGNTSGTNTGDQDLSGKEDALGNPSTNGYVLSSLTDGTRSWIANGSGGSMVYPDAGIAVSTGSAWGTSYSLTTLMEALDDQTWTFANTITCPGITVSQGADPSFQRFREGTTYGGTYSHYLHGSDYSADFNSYIPNYVIGFPNSSAVDSSGAVIMPVSIGVALSDETTDLTTGTAKVTFRAPYAFTLTAVRANVNTAPVGSTLNIDINESGTTVLSTVITIDASEETSTTAETAAVISDSSIADDAEITIDIDQIGSSTAGKGAKVWLIGTRTL